MKELHALTDLQLAILDVLWRRGEATASEVHEELVDSLGLARKTVGTLLTRLEKQRVLTHRSAGREFVYRAAVTRREVGRATVRNVLQRLFHGSLPALVNQALESEEVKPGDVQRVQELIAAWQRQGEEPEP
ncbi:MAG TPA: BlaI/MecI/CopY family transcriptional regulator [Thermoanaerobaculia bacterium]|nr:BlaI/MecI/CopY family transcriptional regulator [Thermoanaerobaculia bacterium]